MDVCLICGPHASDMSLPPQQRMRATAQRCCDALVSVAGALKMVPILNARVPILKFNLPGGAGAPIPRPVPVDLCFNNLNGCRNSELRRPTLTGLGMGLGVGLGMGLGVGLGLGLGLG